jgi:hypothetical protein
LKEYTILSTAFGYFMTYIQPNSPNLFLLLQLNMYFPITLQYFTLWNMSYLLSTCSVESPRYASLYLKRDLHAVSLWLVLHPACFLRVCSRST